MSSSMRWRSGLIDSWLIGGSCLEIGVLQPLDPPDGAPAGHPRSVNLVAVLSAYPGRLLPRERVRCVPGMLNSSEVKFLYPT
jgi:hypothetical protein